jgi:hypothetical protein
MDSASQASDKHNKPKPTTQAAVLVIPGVLFGLLYSAISRSPSLGQHFLALPGKGWMNGAML